MPASAFLLALAAAVVHAGWNVLTAKAEDPQAAAAVGLAIGALVLAPVAIATWDVRAGAWPYAVASVALEVAYFAALAAAYARGPLSLVYPIARGAAPVLVLLGGLVAVGQEPSAAQAAGVVVVALGVLLVRDIRAEGGSAGDTALALLVAACIAGYTLVDQAALDHADPLPYLFVVLAPTAVILLALTGRAGARAAWTPTVAVAGIGMVGAYALTLAALRLADAAPVAAVRESSVVIATGLAVVVLGERVRAARWAGAAIVAAGVAVIALG